MVEATNYVYLAILICLQYLGIQNEFYEVNIDFSTVEEFEQQAPVSVGLAKIEAKENDWLLISIDEKHKIPLTIVKDSITYSERGLASVTKFHEINFDRLLKQQDTIFNKKNEAVATVIKNNKSIEFIMIDNSIYQQVTIKVK